jgi:hypothetical protein
MGSCTPIWVLTMDGERIELLHTREAQSNAY